MLLSHKKQADVIHPPALIYRLLLSQVSISVRALSLA
jgi:hypothetical protein